MSDESRGGNSRQIGNLMPRILSSLSAKDTTTIGSSERATDAETTTGPRGTFSPTIMRPGEHGSATLTPLQRRAIAVVAQAPTGDLHRNPAVLLPPCVRSSLAVIWADVDGSGRELGGGGDGYGWDGYVIGYELTAELSDDDRGQAIAIAEAALWPATEEEIVKELGRLRALTVSRDIGNDLSLVFAAYTHELRQYPAEAIRDVLRSWPRTQRFWPSMAELVERLDRIVKPRRVLREALRREYRPPAVSPDWTQPPSEEDKVAVLELLAENGITFDEHGRMKPMEAEPLTEADIRRVREESGLFRLLDEDDPRVQARLREMGAA